MHASKQTDQYDVSPAHRSHRMGLGAGQRGAVMLSIQEDRVLYRWGCSQRGLLGSWTRCSRTRVLSSPVEHGSLLHIICPRRPSALGPDGDSGRVREGGGGVTLRGNMKSAHRPHLVHHGTQEGALMAELECDATAGMFGMFYGMLAECDVTSAMPGAMQQWMSVCRF